MSIAPASTTPAAPPARGTGFRTKLLVAMMLVVSAVTALGLYFSERNLATRVEEEHEREFQTEFASLQRTRDLRHAALVERCRALVRKPRIHAALEDNALDLLYPSAADELRDMMERPGAPAATADSAAPALRARFYRFLDRRGAVIAPKNPAAVGALTAAEEAALTLPRAPEQPQLGYLAQPGTGALAEVLTMPIISTETGEVIAALALGFKPFAAPAAAPGMTRALWLAAWPRSSPLGSAAATATADEVRRAEADAIRLSLAGTPHLVFAKRLNPDSQYAPAYEVCAFPLTDLFVRRDELRWRVLSSGALVLLLGLGASHLLAARLSAPVEKLAVDSAENLAQRTRAEAALEHTTEELQRSARFSADASHQLKTPVTVLRAGLEELLARENLTPAECQEISALIHQTYRLSGVIEDLLLLSRLDAGRLRVDFAPLDLAPLIAASLDDLSAVPDSLELTVETDLPVTLLVAGEKRYTALILQNLLENARKYNQPAGRVRVAARLDGARAVLTVGNTGRTIPPAAQSHIFERFHRGGMGENVPGYGLGLNLARELARLHGGDLRLARSADGWTEFEVSFRLAPATPA